MATQLIPCRNPKLCGVQNHYPNTASKCSATKVSGSPSSPPPPLAPVSGAPVSHLSGLSEEARRTVLANRPNSPLLDTKTYVDTDPVFGSTKIYEFYEREDDVRGAITLEIDEKTGSCVKSHVTRSAAGRGVAHRDPEDGPAVEFFSADGTKDYEEYLLDGTLCPRPDGGPSRTLFNEETGEPRQQFWVNARGGFHRFDGPAIISVLGDGSVRESYYLDSKGYDSKEEYEKALQTYDRRG